MNIHCVYYGYIQLEIRYLVSEFRIQITSTYSTPCPQKTCDYIFYNNFNNTCPITIIFGIVSTLPWEITEHKK